MRKHVRLSAFRASPCFRLDRTPVAAEGQSAIALHLERRPSGDVLGLSSSQSMRTASSCVRGADFWVRGSRADRGETSTRLAARSSGQCFCAGSCIQLAILRLSLSPERLLEPVARKSFARHLGEVLVRDEASCYSRASRAETRASRQREALVRGRTSHSYEGIGVGGRGPALRTHFFFPVLLRELPP